MAAELSISIGGAKKGSRKLNNFSRALPQNLKRGFLSAGAILLRDMRDKIGGPGYTRNPGRGSPYPGVLHGEMLRTTTMKVGNESGGLTLRVGPNVDYARYHELGTRNIPARPFVGPTLEHKGDDAIDAINKAIVKPLRR